MNHETAVAPAPAVPTPVPLVDLRLQHRRIAEEVRHGMDEVLESASYVLGPQVSRFEQQYASFCGVSHCVGVANGTDAIELALRGLDIGTGDEVVLPANTFVATAEAVARTGAQVVLADCDEDFLLDPAAVAEAMTTRTRAVIGVDLYGQVAPFDVLHEVTGPSAVLVEDAAQSQGATRHGSTSGSFGAVAATSYYPGKNLGAYGDGGAVTTDRDDVAERVMALRNHGGVVKYDHGLLGMNSRLDSLQAAVLSVKLGHLPAWNAERRVAAERYATLLSDLEAVTLPRVVPGNEHVWHLYVVRVPARGRVLDILHQQGIGAGIHYPTPVHLLPPFAHVGRGVGSFPVAERAADEIISLPIYPGITESQQERVAAALSAALA